MFMGKIDASSAKNIDLLDAIISVVEIYSTHAPRGKALILPINVSNL